MARPEITEFVNFDDREQKRRMLTQVGALSGEYEISMIPRRERRSLQQNKWYWSCITKALMLHLQSQESETITKRKADGILCRKFLTVDEVNPKTGEVIGERVRSTRELNTVEMAQFCEQCRFWLADFFNIYVEDPDPNWSVPPTAPARKRAEAV